MNNIAFTCIIHTMIDDDRKCTEDQPDKDHYLQEEKASPTREQLHYTIMIRWRNVINNKKTISNLVFFFSIKGETSI